MKKNRIAILTALILFGNIASSCSKNFPLKVGDDVTKIFFIQEAEDTFWIDKYIIFTYENMNYVVRHDIDIEEGWSYITYIFKCKKSLSLEKDFDRIEPGMLIYKVVELVGFPYDLKADTDVIEVMFKANTGRKYIVQFAHSISEDSNSNLVVTQTFSKGEQQ